MLDLIPSEILSLIAFHLSLESLSPPISLLCTSKPLYTALSPRTNPRLYSRLFRLSFDTSAPTRRLGRRTLTAGDLASELKNRVKVLNRLNKRVTNGDVTQVSDEELWTVYIMMIENDGLNIKHLIGKDAKVDLIKFLKMYHEQHLLAAAIEPGYPKETVGRSLAMWIAYLLSGYDTNQQEHPEDRDERLFVLRPYVFAAQQYELYYGPWTLPDLPLSLSHPHLQAQIPDHNPFIADLTPKSRLQKINYFGSTLSLSHPMLSHAAILRFFARSPSNPLDEEDDIQAPFIDLPSGSSRTDGERKGSSEMIEHRPVLSDSKTHDRDFNRLISCYDPSVCRGMSRAAWRGSWTGCWEGNFSFFDFDAFREMLAGHSRALYEGPFGEQRQVWRIKHTYVRPIRHGLPLTGPITNAGFPTENASTRNARLDSPAAEAATIRDILKGQIEAIKGYEEVPEEELDEAFGDDGGESQGLEMILTGTGHSAWGRFVLRGRVRAWDGMASLVKEYAPDSRGKWIYRGYILSGDVFVGRWRDTFTPEAFVGYEGTFILNRRST
ncbi:hypothetical protein TREMEDRAFT_32015 [Tremella mesenterica DSM 1558]|uniref:uncharacterized protein n=1 Tax=Tremella mesenterica (strain ATCC 24925 / CBS 8224 / DSM 1558 / NBRC 9311 / NRRL Y-6157 / RJB 2259-6 / UBC 559-6) TaxID=578456 RepID=UPI0003F4A556|nr:uncharacterized protein TREMEDRAFT_32015 [Tremella mesenterica DSM 1558]EIW68667.1 hypothetical protein TREMEDRAFT_32015 [Tremella mesenterica DSM 1558]